MDLSGVDLDAVAARIEGVTASFVKELLRKAMLAAAEDGRAAVGQGDLDAALDGLLSETAALTRALLVGSPRAGAEGSPATAWLESLPEPVEPPGGPDARPMMRGR